MKPSIAIPAVLLLGLSSAFAGFSERKLESAQKKAAESGRKVAFVFYQDYYDPNCPKCIQSVSANNNAIKKAIPSSSVVVPVEVDKGDKDLDKLPSIVASGGLPRIVVTDANFEKVIARIDGAPDRSKAKAFEEEVESAD